MSDSIAIRPWDDTRNITIGRGRIIWADSTERKLAGWTLPGGERTQDEAEAREMARAIDKWLGKSGWLDKSQLRPGTAQPQPSRA